MLLWLWRWATDHHPDWRHLLLLLPPLSLLAILSFSLLNTSNSFINNNPNNNNNNYLPSSNNNISSNGNKEEEEGVEVEADLFLHSPLDSNSFKFALLDASPRLASIRIFKPQALAETEERLRVLTSHNSPNGIQVRTRAAAVLQPSGGVPEVDRRVPKAAQLHLRLGHPDPGRRVLVRPTGPLQLHTQQPLPGPTRIRLRRTQRPHRNRGPQLIPSRPVAPRPHPTTRLGRADPAQLGVRLQSPTHHPRRPLHHKAPPILRGLRQAIRVPPGEVRGAGGVDGEPGAAERGEMQAVQGGCGRGCVEKVMGAVEKGWSWTEYRNGSLELCDAHGEWEVGWEEVFDGVAGEELARERRRGEGMRRNVGECVEGMEKVRRRAWKWEAPGSEEICRLGVAEVVDHHR
ncbi:hypothetical protein Syun_005574 [Stephania yunnanensis]|uniref:DUF7796 domain-containing protein n=1 Tax=Stephania yunnanensis TaxID=152371 RepID=A0AAP0L6F8_9MAGN